MSTNGDYGWKASAYRQRKADRLASIKPEWVTNPETGEEFYLRKVGGMMSTVLSGYMPAGLTKAAIEAWKEQGLDAVPDSQEIAATITPEQLLEVDRELESTARTVQVSCVIPLLSNLKPEQVEITEDWRNQAVQGLTQKDPKFNPDEFDFTQLILSPQELDEKDAAFLVRWAQGLSGTTQLKGGGAMNVSDLERFRDKPGRRARTSPNSKKLQHASG